MTLNAIPLSRVLGNVAGRHDQATERRPDCPVRLAYEMAGQLIRGRVVEIDCGHWVPLEKPMELAHLLQEHWKDF
jgi:pimeloyl-ACP methyl ester carboxylesterase